MKKLVVTLVFLITLVGLIIIGVWISKNRRTILLPVGSKLPDKEIAVSLDDNQIGFLHPDGSGLEILQLHLSGGIKEDMMHILSEPRMLTLEWGFDGKSLATRFAYDPHSGVPMIISQDGRVRKCPYIEQVWGRGKVIHTKEGTIITNGEQSDIHESHIVVLDPDTCQVIEKLYSIDTGIARIYDYSYARNGWLAIDLGGPLKSGLVVLDENQQEVFSIEEGFSPLWSYDGNQLTYLVGPEFILFIVDKYGQNKSRVPNVSTYGSAATWSPDGQWIVYHGEPDRSTGMRGYPIYKHNLITGETLLLHEDGYDVTWRD